MSYENDFCAMQAMTRRRSAMLGVLVLCFGAIVMTGACGPSGSVSAGSGGGSPNPAQPTECPAADEYPCMRYRIPLLGNPSTDVALRNKYIGAFGDACYMSEAATFDCFYQKWQAACADAVKIAELAGNQPYLTGYTCEAVGNGDYTLQIGKDKALKITINYQAAPRQTPLIMVNGVPTEVSGPYRNLPDPNEVEPGNKFDRPSPVVNDKGQTLDQRKWVLQVNRNANDGKIHSDLVGFAWPCEEQDGGLTTCIEPDVLEDPDKKDPPPTYPDLVAEVHHVVPMKDLRCCPWGTNSYNNAAVISRKLNLFFTNNDPPEEEVKRLNAANAYAP
jgi:hypothetical protein